MKSMWQRSAIVVVGVMAGAMCAMPQAYTISAKPGAVNYIEGNAAVNGEAISGKVLKTTFLNPNDTLSTDTGKAEVLLTPGVFLRIGENSEIRMISPSLTNTQVEVIKGEAMLESAGLVKENNIQVIDHGGSITIEKDGLYRFTAEEPPTVAVIDGKAEVYFGDQKIDLGKGHETILAPRLKSQKFDTKKEDDLYAWSNVRSEYEAAATYRTAKDLSVNGYSSYGSPYGYGWGGYGLGGWYGPGWYWNNGFNTWAWLPGAGGFYSPFGWGFFGPGYLGYAPVVITPVYGGGYWQGGRWHGKATTATVPVNAKNPPAVGTVTASPFSNQVARSQTAHSFAASGGLRTVSGAQVPVGRASSWSGNGTSSHGSMAAPSHASAGPAFSGGAAHGGGASSGGGSHR